MFLIKDINEIPLIDKERPQTLLNGIIYSEVTSKGKIPNSGGYLKVIISPEINSICEVTESDSKRYLLNQEYLLLNIGETYISEVTKNKSKFLIILINPEMLSQISRFIMPSSSMNEFSFVQSAFKIGDQLGDEIHQLLGLINSDQSIIQIEEQFLEVVGHLIRIHLERGEAIEKLSRVIKKKSDSVYEVLFRTKQIIESQFSTGISLDQISAQVNMSKYHLARVFKIAFDLSPHQYLIRYRLKKAEELIYFSDLSITEIALEVGFSSLSTFTNMFKKHMDINPSNLRK